MLSNSYNEMSFITKNLPTASDKIFYSSLSNFPFLWFSIGSFHFFYNSVFKGKIPSNVTVFLFTSGAGSTYFWVFYYYYSIFYLASSTILPFLRMDLVCKIFYSYFLSSTAFLFEVSFLFGFLSTFLDFDFTCFSSFSD